MILSPGKSNGQSTVDRSFKEEVGEGEKSWGKSVRLGTASPKSKKKLSCCSRGKEWDGQKNQVFKEPITGIGEEGFPFEA